MMNLSLINIILFMSLAWGTNIALNFLYVLKLKFPIFASIDRPIDGGLFIYDKRRFIGNSTTILGLLVSFIISMLVFYSNIFSSHIAILTPILVYFGHTLGSFIKRRVSEKDKFLPFIDHGDYMILSGLVLTILGLISYELAIICLLLTYVLHPLAVVLAFKLGLREKSY